MNIEIENFWIRVNLLAKNLGFNQEFISSSCNINYQTYKGWIKRGVYPNAKELLKIANVLYTTPDYLVYGNKEKNPISDDIAHIIGLLLKLPEDKRKPIVANIEAQVDYWLSNSSD